MNTDSPSSTGTPSKSNSRVQRAAQAKRQNRETILTILLPVVFLLGLGLGWVVWGTGSTSAAQVVDNPNPAAAPQRRVEVAVGDGPSLGPADAPITIVEFSDYECPFCVRWHQQVYTRLMQEYAGQVRFVYRDFPLENIHPNATPAAIAARCAGEQNAYYPFHDALFSSKYGLGREAYLSYASELGLNVASFQTCLDEKRYADQVEESMRYGFSLGVNSTPTFFINGVAVVGAQPYEVFQQAIEKELADLR